MNIAHFRFRANVKVSPLHPEAYHSCHFRLSSLAVFVGLISSPPLSSFINPYNISSTRSLACLFHFNGVCIQVGSQSSVLDVSASFSQTAVIVSGIDATPTIYLCGQNPPADFFHPQIFRISSVEKVSISMCII